MEGSIQIKIRKIQVKCCHKYEESVRYEKVEQLNFISKMGLYPTAKRIVTIEVRKVKIAEVSNKMVELQSLGSHNSNYSSS